MKFDLDKLLPKKPTPNNDIPWSGFQQAIFETCVTKPTLHVSVNAVPGSGKTTTLKELANRLDGDMLALAFNKSIATSLQAAMPHNVQASTFHSFGAGLARDMIKRHALYPAMDKNKHYGILKNVVPKDLYDLHARDLAQMLSKATAFAVGIEVEPTPAFFEIMAEDMMLTFDEVRPVIRAQIPAFMTKAYKQFLVLDGSFNFDDMLFLPCMHASDVAWPTYTNVLVDEAQDLSPIQHLMLAHLASAGARIIAVGDPRQAIYAFRGASHNSMELLNSRFCMTPLPLSICYRCDSLIVNEAAAIEPDILARNGAPPGKVERLNTKPIPADYGTDAIVLCRNNAPLFELALDFVRAGVRCQLRSGMGDQLIRWVDTFECETVADLEKKLKTHVQSERKKLEAKKKWSLLDRLFDKTSALMTIIESVNPEDSPRVVQRRIQYLIRSKQGTTLSTIHKAKGEEADKVYLLRPDLIPSHFAKDEESIQQEDNLLYVAITRAKHHFIYLPSEENC